MISEFVRPMRVRFKNLIFPMTIQESKVRHFRIVRSDGSYLIMGSLRPFASLPALIAAHQVRPACQGKRFNGLWLEG